MYGGERGTIIPIGIMMSPNNALLPKGTCTVPERDQLGACLDGGVRLVILRGTRTTPAGMSAKCWRGLLCRLQFGGEFIWGCRAGGPTGYVEWR